MIQNLSLWNKVGVGVTIFLVTGWSLLLVFDAESTARFVIALTVTICFFIWAFKSKGNKSSSEPRSNQQSTTEIPLTYSDTEIKLNKIKAKIQSSGIDGFSRYLAKKEINYIPEVLLEDEEFDCLIQGSLGIKNGILFLTNKRLVFLDRGMFGRTETTTFLLKQIGGIDYANGMMLAEIRIHSTGMAPTKIENVAIQEARKFTQKVNECILNVNNPNPQVVPLYNANTPNIADELLKLSNLKNSGVLTESEFNDQKAKLLNRL